jgi:hypothetical protein
MRLVLPSMFIASLCLTFAVGVGLAQSEKPNTGPGKSPELRQLGKHLAKGQADRNAGSYGGSAPLLFHAGGTVVSSTTEVHPIYWGTKWADSAFVGDKIAGLALFYAGASWHYLSTNTEYTGSTGLHTSDLLVEPDPDHPHIDSAHAAPVGDVQPITVLNEVCAVVGSATKRHAYYPVYVDSPRGTVGYCAYHSSGTCANGTPVDFAFFFNLDGDSGCNPQDTETGHSQGLAALANVSGHELSERQSDPFGNAWFDMFGYENSDKCAWTFGPSALLFSNNTIWKVQGNWSNAAFTASRGYTYAGKKYTGCIDGTNEH